MSYMKFVIMVPTEKGTHRPVLEWDVERILTHVDIQMKNGANLRSAFESAIEEFKKKTTKLSN